MNLSAHELRIWFSDSYAARKWTAQCTCGWAASCQTEVEAKKSAEIHRGMRNFLDRFSEK